MFRYYVYKMLYAFKVFSYREYQQKLKKHCFNKSSDYLVVSKSKFFDANWYLSQNPDVAIKGMDPCEHYLKYGWKEGRNPSPLFDGNAYLHNYLDVNRANLNPLIHFIGHGQREGREVFALSGKTPARITQDVFFSVIVASYNYEDYIRETLESLVNQTYKNFEVIVVDDGSSDNSVKVIREYEEKYPCVHLYQHPNGENRGLPETVLLGLTKSKGEYIAFCESDDSWSLTHLEELNKFINENPRAHIVVNDVETFGDEDRCAEMQRVIEHRKNEILRSKGMISAANFRRSNYILTFSACCVNRILLQSCDFLGVNKKTSLDWWLWRQICLDNQIYYLNEPLTYWRLHTDSYNKRNEAEESALHLQFVELLDKVIERRIYSSVFSLNRTFKDFTPYQKIASRNAKLSILSRIRLEGIAKLKILYITITPRIDFPIQDPSARYRCYHPAEVLNLNNFVSVISWHHFSQKPNFDYDIYIIHRPKEAAIPLINQLKDLNKILIADYDDLIFGTPDQAKDCSVYKNGQLSLEQTKKLFESNQRALFCFDCFTVSTNNLAKEIQRLHTKAVVQVVHNFIPDSILALANKWKLRQQEKNPNLLMYCPGTMSHNRDFALVQDVFLRSLEKNPKLRLYIFGCLQSTDKLLKHPQICFHGPTSYWNLFQHMAQAAYTIAPLEDSCFNDCKSNVKFLESATAGATLLATPIEDMQRISPYAAVHLLQTADDWADRLSQIGNDNFSHNIKTNYHCLLEHCARKTFLQEFTSLFEKMED